MLRLCLSWLTEQSKPCLWFLFNRWPATAHPILLPHRSAFEKESEATAMPWSNVESQKRNREATKASGRSRQIKHIAGRPKLRVRQNSVLTPSCIMLESMCWCAGEDTVKACWCYAGIVPFLLFELHWNASISLQSELRLSLFLKHIPFFPLRYIPFPGPTIQITISQL